MLAGGELYDTRLHILDLHTRTPMPVEQDTTADYYYRVLTWLPDGSEVVFARYSRLMDRVDIQAADALTGAVRTLATDVECYRPGSRPLMIFSRLRVAPGVE